MGSVELSLVANYLRVDDDDPGTFDDDQVRLHDVVADLNFFLFEDLPSPFFAFLDYVTRDGIVALQPR